MGTKKSGFISINDIVVLYFVTNKMVVIQDFLRLFVETLNMDEGWYVQNHPLGTLDKGQRSIMVFARDHLCRPDQ